MNPEYSVRAGDLSNLPKLRQKLRPFVRINAGS